MSFLKLCLFFVLFVQILVACSPPETSPAGSPSPQAPPPSGEGETQPPGGGDTEARGVTNGLITLSHSDQKPARFQNTGSQSPLSKENLQPKNEDSLPGALPLTAEDSHTKNPVSLPGALPPPPTPVLNVPTMATSTPPVLRTKPSTEEQPATSVPDSTPPPAPSLNIPTMATSTPPVLRTKPSTEEQPATSVPDSTPPPAPSLNIPTMATSTPPVLRTMPPVEEQPLTTVPHDKKENTPPSPPFKPLSLSPQAREMALKLCDFSSALKTAVERELSEGCRNISPEAMTSLTRLKLTLNDEEGRLIKPRHFLPFPGLKILDLSHNPHLTSLPDFVTQLNIHTLDVSRTGITDFGYEMENMKQLQVLVASHNRYKNNEIPLPVFGIENLKALDVSYSGLRYIDENSIFLQKLEEFHLQGNQLVQLPALIYLMPKLLLVDLRDNHFTDKEFMVRHSCIEAENQEECQQEMLGLSGFECGWKYEYPYQRGEPARRFRVMTDEEFNHYATNGRPNRDICLSWHLYQETLREDHPRREFLSKTVNGKTIREWRMVVDFHNNDNQTSLIFPFMALSPAWWRSPYTHCVWTQKGYFKLTGMIWPNPTDFLPKVQEVFPERYPPREENPALPEECKDYQYISSLSVKNPQPKNEVSLQGARPPLSP